MLVNKNENSQAILDAFNNAHPTIKFEVENCSEDNSLNILDVNIKLSPEGHITTKFYEKQAKQDLFLHAGSAVSALTKKATICAELKRIDSLCSSDDGKDSAKQKFFSKLGKNGYTQTLINKLTRQSQRTNTSLNQNPPIYISVPFISDSFQRKLKTILSTASNTIQIPVHLSNKNTNTIRTSLNKLKHKKPCTKRVCPLNKESMCNLSYVVYHAKCSICTERQDYVGSSRQLFHERVHQHYTKPTEAIYQHNNIYSHTGHPFSYKILAKCHSLKEMLFTEAIHIKKIRPTLNRRHEMDDVLHLID